MIGALRQADTDVVEALTDASDHLDFAGRLAHAASLPAEAAAAVEAALARVHERLSDQRLRLAVIGEFSTGKTTFINALLRQPLLPVSVLPTTAAAVWLEYGDELAIQVSLKTSAELYDTSGVDGAASLGRLLAHVRSLTGGRSHPPSSLHEVLALLTSDDDVACQVASLRVRVPAESLANGLVIIDCPGANASARHTEIAREVVAAADLAVVLVSALEPVPMSLAEFLTDAFDARVLGRCAYLATRMDGIAAGEQPALLAAIKDRLTQQLEVIDPVVEPAAAHTVLLQAAGRRLSEVEAHWLDRFGDTEYRLTSMMLSQRVASVSDSTLRLLDELLEGIRGHLDARVAELSARRELVAASRIRDMDAFLVEQAAAADRVVDPVINLVRWHAREDLLGGVPTVTATCDSLLDGATSGDALKKAVEGPVGQAIQSGVTQWFQWVRDKSAPQLAQAVQTACDTVDRSFQAEYSRLGNVVGRQYFDAAPVLEVAAIERAVGSEMSAVVASAAAQVSENNVRTGWGVAAGIAIGAVVLGPVGAAAGAFIGGAFASNVKQAREKVRPSVHTAVRQAFDKAAAEAVDALWKAGIRCKARMSDHLASYRGTYERAVRAILADQERQAARLSAERDAIAEGVAEADRRRRQIQTQRDRVATRGTR